MIKQCRRCQENRNISEFQKYSRSSDGLQLYCRACKKQMNRNLYERKPRRNYERNKAAAHRNRLWFYEYMKTKKCEWEGCTVDDPDMLVLDHLNPAEKRIEISRMVNCSYSLESVELEVSKCRVLCANHHQKHTIQQFGYKKWQPKE